MPDAPDRTQIWRGRICVLVAATLWSTSGFFAQAPYFDSWPAESRGIMLAFWRAVVASCVLLPMVRRMSWSWLMPFMLAAFAAMNYTFLSALTLTSAANAIWLQFISPVWVFVIGVFFLGEKRHRRDWLLMTLAGSGVLFILAFEIRGEAMLGVMYGLLSGVFLACVILCIRQLREHDTAWLIVLNHVVCAALFLPYVASVRSWPSGMQWPLLIGFGALQMGIPYFLFGRGLKSLSGHEASGIGLIEPILVPLWVHLAWSHTASYTPPAWWTFVGGGLILLGLVLRYAPSRRPEQTNPPQSRNSGRIPMED